MNPAASSEPAIKTLNLSKRYPGLVSRKGANGLAVNDLSITVNQGDIYGFLGPNGSGKTTTIRMIMGLVRPTSGKIFVTGSDAVSQRLDASSVCGAMIDVPAFYGYLSAKRNLRILADLAGCTEPERIEKVLDLVGLLNRADSKVKTFSHGMKQRLGFAMAILRRPKVLLLDEPTNGLDPEGNWAILQAIKRTNIEEGTTILFSSHLLSEVEEICNRTAIIRQGRLLYEGEVKQLVSAGNVVELRVENRDRALEILLANGMVTHDPLKMDGTIAVETEDPAAINDMLVSNGVRVTYLAPRKRTLREVFLGYMNNSGHSSEAEHQNGPEV